MKGKKLLALLTTAVMAGSVLAGCGAGSSSAGQTQPTADAAQAGDTQAAEAAAPGELDTSEEVALTMYIISDRPAGQDVVDENLNKILKEKLNCTLDIRWIGWGEFTNKYPLLFTSGEEFDLAYASSTWLNAFSMARKGAFMNLDELWPTYAPKNFERQSDFAKELATVDGHYYIIPTLLGTYSAYGPIYRGDLVEGSDWDGVMEDFSDIEEYCDIIKELHPEIEPLDQYSMAPEWSYVYWKNMGYETPSSMRYFWFDPTEDHPQLKTYYELPETKEFLEMMKRWSDKGFFSKSALSDTDSTKLQNGKAALKVHNVDSYNGVAVLHPEWDMHYANFNKHVAHIPFTTDSVVVSNTSKNPERALALWELITNDQEVYDAFYYGVLGETYNINEKGEFEITDPDLYSTSAMWAARTPEFNRSQVGSAEDYDSLRQGFEEEIAADQSTERFGALSIDTSSFETELSAVTNVWQQYWWPLELGYTNDIDASLAEYEKMMKNAGADKMLEEIQKQLDAYCDEHPLK